MKIVIVIRNIAECGGTERAVFNLINLLNQHDITIYSLCSNNDDSTFYKSEVFFNTRHFGLGEIPVFILNKLKWYYNVGKIIRKNISIDKPDFILGTGHNINSVLGFIKNRSTKFFGAEHIDINTIPKFSKLIMMISYPKLDGLIVLSEISKLKVLKLNKKIYIIPNSIDYHNQDNVGKNCQIIMVGRISPEKGYDRLLPIARFLQTDYPEWKINIYGDGILKEKIIGDLRKKHINNVNFFGAVSDIDIKYRSSNIFIMTSYTEAMPMVVLEAKSFGLPVLAYRNEGTELLIHDSVNGFLADDEIDFLSKLERLIKNDNLTIQFANESKKQLQQYSEFEISKKWNEIFTK